MSETHSFTVGYVRHEMQGPLPPPVAESGAVKWMRENLFSSWLNAILTVVSLFVIWWVLSHTLPWMLAGVWSASSLTDCRNILAERGYSSGACWAVITERWPQLIFGFYPSELYWRPILAFVLLIGAVAPVLYTSLPRKMLWFSLIYPLIAYYLLWGGSVWTPVMLAVGFSLVGMGGTLASNKSGFFFGVLIAILIFLLMFFDPLSALLNVMGGIAGLFSADSVRLSPMIGSLALRDLFPLMPTLSDLLGSIAPIGLESVTSREIGGFLLALVIGLSAIVFSMPLGILLALGRQSDLFIINKVCVTFIEVIRGIPLIVWLFTASTLLNYFLPPGTTFDLILRVIIMVTFFAAAYIAEVIRGGLAALPKGQYEGADSLGLDYWQSMRLIILPQALKISIPGIVNTFIGLFKDTVLVVFIGLLDPIGFINLIRATVEWNGIYWELYIFVGLCFFLFCFFMSRYSQYLERKLRTDHR